MQRSAKILGLVVVLGGLAAAAVEAGGRKLEYYDPNISQEDLKAEMKILQRSVGASECAYCHVVKPKRDFGADTDNKKTTRYMLKMSDKISKDLFTKEALQIKEGDPPKATCYMCHKGKEKPEYKPANAEQEKAQAKFEEENKKPDRQKIVDAMKKIVEKINKDHFTWKNAPKATCWMCHRGQGEFSTKLPDEEKDSGDNRK